MNFEMSAEELAVVESAEQVAREVIQPLAQHYDETETFCLASIRALTCQNNMAAWALVAWR